MINADKIYQAVVNHEEQFSVWPADTRVPNGWRLTGHRGTKQQCLTWIDKTWTDMRPLSLRDRPDES